MTGRRIRREEQGIKTYKILGAAAVFKGVTPFWCVDIVRLALLVALPGLSLTLPRLFYQ